MQSCPFKKAKCHTCQQVGHLAIICQNASGKHYTRYIGVENSDNNREGPLGICAVTKGHTIGQNNPKYMVTVCLTGQQVSMERDTRVVVSVTSEEMYKRHLSSYPLCYHTSEARGCPWVQEIPSSALRHA